MPRPGVAPYIQGNDKSIVDRILSRTSSVA
jgi:hypothetical protein